MQELIQTIPLRCFRKAPQVNSLLTVKTCPVSVIKGLLVGRICNSFEKNRAFYDKSMKLGTWLVDNNTNKLRVNATPKMSSNGRHLVFSKMAAFLNLFIIMSLLICKHNVFFC